MSPSTPATPEEAYASEAVSRWSFASGDVACVADDGCPTVTCTCRDRSRFAVSGCLLYACLDDAAGYCAAQCAAHDGPGDAQRVDDPPCATTPDRDGCLACRKRVGETQQNEACQSETDALRTCLVTLDATRGLLSGVRSQDWWQDGVPCKSERDAYLRCMQPVERALERCAQDRVAHWEPFRPVIAEPDSPESDD